MGQPQSPACLRLVRMRCFDHACFAYPLGGESRFCEYVRLALTQPRPACTQQTNSHRRHPHQGVEGSSAHEIGVGFSVIQSPLGPRLAGGGLRMAIHSPFPPRSRPASLWGFSSTGRWVPHLGRIRRVIGLRVVICCNPLGMCPISVVSRINCHHHQCPLSPS